MALDFETAAMVENLILRAETAAAAALNIGAQQIVDRSQLTVPRDDDPQKMGSSLADSAVIVEAVPGKLEATVVYDSPYAAAQERGEMSYENRRAGKTVVWKATSYTTPGTGPHYLETAGKSVEAEMPAELQVQGDIYFA